jgi:acyl carrier protein
MQKDSDSLDDKVIAIIAAQARRPTLECGRDTQLTELGLESLDVIEIIFALEEEFDVEIPFNANDTQSVNLDTVGNVITAVRQYVDEK